MAHMLLERCKSNPTPTVAGWLGVVPLTKDERMAYYVLVPWPKFPLLEKRGERTSLFNWKHQWKQREHRWSPVIKAEQAVAPKTQLVIGWAWLSRRAPEKKRKAAAAPFPQEVRLVPSTACSGTWAAGRSAGVQPSQGVLG